MQNHFKMQAALINNSRHNQGEGDILSFFWSIVFNGFLSVLIIVKHIQLV